MKQIRFQRWNDFQRILSQNWRQGEHVVLIGATGSGKTRLLREIVPHRTYTTILATKPYDDSMDEIAAEDGYTVFTEWPINLSAHAFPRRIIWPVATTVGSVQKTQKPAFKLVLDNVYVVGGWTLVIDELWFFTNVLKFGPTIKLYLTQARSMHISLVQCAQRTAWVPVECFNQSTHHFYFRENDERNLSVISGICYPMRNEIKAAVMDLPPHHFLYFNKVTTECVISMVEHKRHPLADNGTTATG